MNDKVCDGPGGGATPLRPVKVGRALVLLATAAAVLAVSGVASRGRDEERLAQWTHEQAIPTVALVSAKRGAAPRELTLPGNVEAFYTASLHAQVSGYVREWLKDIGATVRKGDVLAVVDTPELDQSLAVAESELTKAKANLALAKVTAGRWDSLRSSAAVSQQAADEKDADAHARAAEVAAAEAGLERLKAEKAFANITAPFDGVVTQRNVDIGALVKADPESGAGLYAVADIHKMRVYVPVPETYAAEMKDGMRARLDLPEYPNRKFEATIVATSHAIDKAARVMTVELIADNADGALSPGAFARVQFELPPDRDTTRVPASALLYRDDAAEVGVVDKDGRVALKPVRIVRDLGTEVEIAGGLADDDRIVANPPDSITAGEAVRVANGDDGRETMAQSGEGGHE